MKEKLKNRYQDIIKAIEESEAEINSMVRQKQTLNSTFEELIIAQSKLKSAEKLVLNILNYIEKYEILEGDIDKQIQISRQNKFQRKQNVLDKMYGKERNKKWQEIGQKMK